MRMPSAWGMPSWSWLSSNRTLAEPKEFFRLPPAEGVRYGSPLPSLVRWNMARLTRPATVDGGAVTPQRLCSNICGASAATETTPLPSGRRTRMW